jgi:hypothetical protein
VRWLLGGLLFVVLAAPARGQAEEGSAATGGETTPEGHPLKKEDKIGRKRGAPLAAAVSDGPIPQAALPKLRRVRGRLRQKLAEIVAPVSIVNLWTREVLPVTFGQGVGGKHIDRFFRCHFTGHQTKIERKLVELVIAAARKFKSDRVEIVSSFRAPKYNLMLRKKGREVAGGSNHMAGKAIDFRIPGVSTRRLRAFVLKAGLGGVGYYPRSRFVHADVGPRRTWKGK